MRSLYSASEGLLLVRVRGPAMFWLLVVLRAAEGTAGPAVAPLTEPGVLEPAWLLRLDGLLLSGLQAAGMQSDVKPTGCMLADMIPSCR